MNFDVPHISPHQNTHGLTQTSQKAVLYLFSPRPFSNQVRRPLLYRFGEQFVNAANTALHASNSPNKNFMSLASSPYAFGAVIPSENGIVTRMGEMSDKWSFLLIVNGEEPHHRLVASGFEDVQIHSAMRNRLKNNRSIYCGFCLDEPINPTTMNSHTPTPNPFATFVVTHKTFINQMSTFGANGLGPTRYDVTADNDIVDPSLANLISADVLHQITPDKLLDSSEIMHGDNGDRFRVDIPGEMMPINPSQGMINLTSAWSEPRENLKRILHGITVANDAVFSSQQMGTLSTPHFDDLGMFGNHDMYTDTLINQYRSNGHPGMGLQENEVITMSGLEARYHPEVIPFNIGRSSQWDTMDQTIRCRSNVWSSLLMNAVPVLLTNAGLSEISFEYDSTSDQEQIFTVSHIATVSEAEKVAAVRAFLFELKSRLFTMMKVSNGGAHGGDFRVHMSIQSGGISHCTLNFYDDEIINTAPVEAPTIAGGLTSNLLAPVEAAAQNSQELIGLVDAVMGADGGVDYGTAPVYQNPNMAQHFAEPSTMASSPEVPSINTSRHHHTGDSQVPVPNLFTSHSR